MQLPRAALTCSTLAVAFALGCSGGRSPISPDASPFGASGAGPDGSTLKIDAPSLQSPANGVQFEDETSPVLVIGNVQGRYAQFPVTYEFEIRELTGDDFTLRPTVAASPGGTTAYTIAQELDFETDFSWRVRATYNGAVGPWSATRTFRTMPEPVTGIICNGPTEVSIVACVREAFGFMGSSELVDFLRAVAANLNRHNFEDGPYGILVKTTGNNCDGYSCDIICSGQGNDQKQWDVLLDTDGAQAPVFSGPEEVPHIRVDQCEIQ